MKLLGFFTSMISMGWWIFDDVNEAVTQIANTIMLIPFMLIALIPAGFIWLASLINALVYSILNWSYDIFNIMATMNINTLSNYISGIISRINAIIIVIVVYNFAVTIFNYLTNPDDAKKSGVTFLKNIFVTAVLLISYNLIFGLFNEVSLLILGNRTNYDFPILSQIITIDSKADQGLISRFVFGTKEGASEGSALSCGVSQYYIPFREGYDPGIPNSGTEVECTGDYSALTDFGSAYAIGFNFVTSWIDHEVIEKSNVGPFTSRYVWVWYRVIGIVIAVIMAYFILKACIGVGIRMFKLMVLQICAPLPIVSILTEGSGDKSKFRQYCSTYFATFIEIFVRLLVMFIVTAFVLHIFDTVQTFIPDVDADTNTLKGITTIPILTGIMAIAAFAFLNYAPAFIDEALGTKMASSLGAIGDGILGSGFGAFASVKNAWKKNKYAMGADGKPLDGEDGRKKVVNGRGERILGALGAGIAGAGAGYRQGSGVESKGNSIRDKLASYSQLAEDTKQAGEDASNNILESEGRRKQWAQNVKNKLDRIKNGEFANGGKGSLDEDEFKAAMKDIEEKEKAIDVTINDRKSELEAKISDKSKLEQTKVKLDGQIENCKSEIELADKNIQTSDNVLASLSAQQSAVNKISDAQVTLDNSKTKAETELNAKVNDANSEFENKIKSVEVMSLGSDARDARIKEIRAERDQKINDAKAEYQADVKKAEDNYKTVVTESTKEYKNADGNAIDNSGRVMVKEATEYITQARVNAEKTKREAEVIKENRETEMKAYIKSKADNDVEITNITTDIDSRKQDIKNLQNQKENVTSDTFEYDFDDPNNTNPEYVVKKNPDGSNKVISLTKKQWIERHERIVKDKKNLEERSAELEKDSKKAEDQRKSLRSADTKRYTSRKK